MSQDDWKLVCASVTGFDHLDAGTGGQDRFEAQISADGWLVAAICDGAGSAPLGAQGAEFFSSFVVAQLKDRLEKAIEETGAPDDPDIADWVYEVVASGRRDLRDAFACDDLSRFHATLVGVVAGPSGGQFFHIGDGAACAMRSGDIGDFVTSRPENGEYANETFFVTQDVWSQHLRFTSFGAEHDLLALMSDGVTPFAMDRGVFGPHPPFFEPLSAQLAAREPQEGARALEALFARDSVRAITGDDKTLIWALRRRAGG